MKQVQKIDGTTYQTASGYYVERMADNTWTAYLPVSGADDRYLWAWHSPKHSTRTSALRAVSFHRRRSS